ncbi:hypothetical protein FQ775_01130 [Nitratireductor mangrovi]|uniref:Chromosomal replication initiator DnaA C-terminal domain-containing protein n=1 Tax=Nitratireductor mangrovi TaxID=2599600 RepID=A0A5B8KU03_9HYPH|nr:helix-turn-helix domain-containing protein [Nitratireductor mangrovi]QDY99084.1 hypothetical protein FQ775_01130 [Nitratireductor mangrovi]
MIAIREIIALTALNFGFDARDIVADNRTTPVRIARHVAMYVARKTTPHSMEVIGKAFNRDHTTVIYAVEKIEAEIRADPKLKALVKAIARNVEFRERIEALGGIDVLPLARRIAADPVRRAMSASVMEVSALAGTMLDLWEIAQAAEEAIRLRERVIAITSDEVMTSALMEEEDATSARIAALETAILDEMAALRGETPEEEETTDGRCHS